MRRLLCFLMILSLFSFFSTVHASEQPQGYLALTFDDGPSGEQTNRLLDGLKARGVQATFFVCAYRVWEHPENLCRMASEGHEIGLHGCCHAYMHKMSYHEIAEDLVECRLAVTEVCGICPVLFRPPGGLSSHTLLCAAKDENLRVILWSVDTLDWNRSAARGAYRRILSQAGDGEIILMHELSEQSVDTALKAIDKLQADGFCFCTVSELAARKNQILQPGKSYLRFGG